jgi:hypothetical protein
MGTAVDGWGHIEEIVLRIATNLPREINEEVQAELARVIVLLRYFRNAEYSYLVGLVEVAIAALLVEPPNLTLARGIREEVEREIRRSQNIFAAIGSARTPAVRVVLGFGVLLYFLLPLFMVYVVGPGRSRALPETLLNMKTGLLLLVAIMGALGSVVSIMVRIQDFAQLRSADPAVLFFTGLFKPIIGTSFALFVFAVLKAALIPIKIDESVEQYFFMAISFISGFSERFASDIASTTERQIGTVASRTGASAGDSAGARGRT